MTACRDARYLFRHYFCDLEMHHPNLKKYLILYMFRTPHLLALSFSWKSHYNKQSLDFFPVIKAMSFMNCKIEIVILYVPPSPPPTSQLKKHQQQQQRQRQRQRQRQQNPRQLNLRAISIYDCSFEGDRFNAFFKNFVA